MSWRRQFLVVWVLASLAVGSAGSWPARAEAWQPVQLTVRDRGAGRVTVTATWQGVREGTLVLRVAFDTHSVDLSGFDVASNTVLRDEAGRELLGSYLAREGFEVQTAADGQTALAAARTFRPDVVVLVVLLPGLDGLEVLRRLRAEGETYVILLTAKVEEADRVVGLELGADDYVTKPFSPRELVARIRAVLRRGRGRAEVPEAPLVFRRLRIDPARREVWRDGERVQLTALEFDLLRALASFPGRVWSREQLIERVWGQDYFGDERVVDAHIKELRRKLGDDPARPSLIGTIRGVGYRFVDEPA